MTTSDAPQVEPLALTLEESARAALREAGIE